MQGRVDIECLQKSCDSVQPTAINIVNSFSPTCQLNEEGGIVCDKCLPGYTGSQCERYVH